MLAWYFKSKFKINNTKLLITIWMQFFTDVLPGLQIDFQQVGKNVSTQLSWNEEKV